MTRLPRSVQPFVRACMQPLRAQGAELLLSSDFFGRPVWAAQAFLAALQPSEQDAPTHAPGTDQGFRVYDQGLKARGYDSTRGTPSKNSCALFRLFCTPSAAMCAEGGDINESVLLVCVCPLKLGQFSEIALGWRMLCKSFDI